MNESITCGRFIPARERDLLTRLTLMENYLARLTEILEAQAVARSDAEDAAVLSVAELSSEGMAVDEPDALSLSARGGDLA